MSKYVFIKGFFDTLDLFSDEIITELTIRGDKCLCLNLDTMDRDLKALFKGILDEPITAVIAFNNLGYNLGEEEGSNIWERFNVPYIDILMDHPFHFYSKLSHMPKTTHLFCIDKNHVRFVKKYFPEIENVHFLAHAGCLHAIKDVMGDYQTESNDSGRDIDILYAGSLSRVLVENLIPDFDSFKEIDGAAFCEEILSTLIREPFRTTEEVIATLLKEKGIELTPQEELYYINGFRFTDGFAVSYFRELSVRILVENGFKVGVLGLGWEQCDWADNPNLSILGKVDAKEVLFYMKRAKIVLNTLTWFKEGSHDRIPNGMLSGAAVLTDNSGYLREHFTDGEDISFFELEDMGRLPYIADKLLGDDEYRRNIINRAYEKAINEHTWKNRIEEILLQIQKAR